MVLFYQVRHVTALRADTPPPETMLEFAHQVFKHDFHPPAAGNLLLVLNVTSTYDWSDLNFIRCCTVAVN